MNRLRSLLGRIYTREGFRGPVVTLLSGTALTLGLSYLAVPILTRLFTPAEFGVSDYFVTMVSVFITVASLRYEDALMLPEDDEKAADVFWLAGLLTVVTCLAIGVATVWSTSIAEFLRVPDAAPWLWLLAPTLLLMRAGKLSELWFTRQKLFRLITGGEAANKVTMIASRIGAGAATTLGAGGLICGFALGHAASTLFYGTVLLQRAALPLKKPSSLSALKSAAVRFRRFPLFSTPSAFLNAVVSRLPVLLLPFFFGLEVVGLFGRAFMALAVPLSLIGGAVSQVFFVHATEAHREGRLDVLSETVHRRLVMVGLFPTAVLIIAAPQLFEFVFGEGWGAAGVFERYLAFWFFLSGVASPLTRLFDVLERQRLELLISITTSLALVAALLLGGRSGNVLWTMVLLGAAGAAVRLLQLGTMLRMSHVPLGRAALVYLRYALASAPFLLPIWLARDAAPLWVTAGVAAVAGLAYYGLIIWQEKLLSTARAR